MFVSRRVIVSLLLLLSCFAAGSNSTEHNPKPGDEDWGYIEVRPGARMFYWLYYSTADPKPASLPLVHHVNVLFIDNPVGTGYSHVEDEKLLTKNNQEITADLITFTKSFYAKYPHFKKSPMAIFGESYGGKMNVEFALELDKGIVDMRGYNEIMHVVEKCRKAVEKNEWNAAFRYWWLSEIKVANATFGVDFYNILEKTKPFYYDDVEDRLPLSLQKEFFSEENYRKEDVNDVITEKLATRVSDLAPYGKQSTQVFSALRSDFMRPVTHLVEELLNTTNIDVVVYNGHLDLIVSTIGQMKWVDRLKWPGKKQYVAAKRKPVVPKDNPEMGIRLLREVFVDHVCISASDRIAAAVMFRRMSGALNNHYSIIAGSSNSTEHNPKPGDEDWGYIEVRPGARMFYWLYYSTADPDPASLPLVIWLQGGPGSSSSRYGNFALIGPLDEKMNPRNSSWVHHVNVLFIDNPVGTGYSHVEDEELLTKNNQEITADLITFTKSFYAKYPNFKKSPMAIFGESYGGKMNVEFALELDKVYFAVKMANMVLLLLIIYKFLLQENYRKGDAITEKLATRVSDLAPFGKQSKKVFSALRSDFLKPVTDLVEELLNTTNIDVVVYNGHLDLIVSTVGQMKWVDRLKWPGKKEYVAAKRNPVVIDDHLEGYLKKHEHFSFWWINRAGHMVPKDNPEMGVKLVREVFGLPPVN
ncbi:hypothetical protein B566_EDAN005370 [Ephemera danica]|nr:hypothetical protein B566_EDAN005370 [Ephemera danica]